MATSASRGAVIAERASAAEQNLSTLSSGEILDRITRREQLIRERRDAADAAERERDEALRERDRLEALQERRGAEVQPQLIELEASLAELEISARRKRKALEYEEAELAPELAGLREALGVAQQQETEQHYEEAIGASRQEIAAATARRDQALASAREAKLELADLNAAHTKLLAEARATTGIGYSS